MENAVEREFAGALAPLLTDEGRARQVASWLGEMLGWEFVKDWFPTFASYWPGGSWRRRRWWHQQRPLA